MGCSASKTPAQDSTPRSPVKTIEVASNDDHGKTETQRVAIEGTTPNLQQKQSPKKNGKKISVTVGNDNSNDVREVDENGSNQLAFVKREENDAAADSDVKALNEIITNSAGHNVKEIIKILGPVSYAYRQLIRKKFQERYDEDLLEKTVLNEEKQIETCLKCLLRNQSEFLSYFMHQSIKKSDFKSLVEILTAWPPECVGQAKEKYREDRRVEFLEDVTNSLGEKMPEEQKSMLIALASLERDGESKELDESIVNEECGELSQGAQSIIDILTTKPYNRDQLRSIFEQFKAKYYLDIKESIEIEFHDEITETVLQIIVEIANDTTLHFATQLEDILSKQSVNIDRLLFTIIGRQPMNLHDIVKRFEETFNKSLVDTLVTQLKSPIQELLVLSIERSKET